MKSKSIGLIIMSLLMISSSSNLTVSAYAADKNTSSNKYIQSINDTTDIIADSDLKTFNDLKKVPKYLGFDYKLPDYLPDRFYISGINIWRIDDKYNTFQISFDNKKTNELYTLSEFKNDPVAEVNRLALGEDAPAENSEITKTAKTINGTKGFDIVVPVHQKYIDYMNYFAWEDNGLWYCINYTYFGDRLSDQEIGKIIASLKAPSEIKDVDYTIVPDSELIGVPVYDREDLNKCINLLGYSPKVPLGIDDNLKIIDCHLLQYNYDDNPYAAFYCSYLYKDNSSIQFIQEKDSDKIIHYDQHKENDYVVTGSDNTEQKIKHVTMNNIDVMKYVDSSCHRTVYEWQDDDVYYQFEFYYNGTPQWVDNIVEEFVKAEPAE